MATKKNIIRNYEREKRIMRQKTMKTESGKASADCSSEINGTRPIKESIRTMLLEIKARTGLSEVLVFADIFLALYQKNVHGENVHQPSFMKIYLYAFLFDAMSIRMPKSKFIEGFTVSVFNNALKEVKCWKAVKSKDKKKVGPLCNLYSIKTGLKYS